MPEPLTHLEAVFVEGSAWDPDDSNTLTLASQRVQDVWEVRHDADGYHTRDPLVSVESAFVHWDGAAYSITEANADSTLSISAFPSVGFIEFTVGSAFSNTDYTPMVDVEPSGTEVVAFYEDSAFAKSVTQFQVVLFNDAGAFVDRDFMIHVFGSRL